MQDFSAGYIERAIGIYPKQGEREPWVNPQNFKRDRVMFLQGEVEDEVLTFGNSRAVGSRASDEPSPLKAAG